eukprot:COSAG01_NODE_17_length_39991_cov_30.596160_10_plen_123_part_00
MVFCFFMLVPFAFLATTYLTLRATWEREAQNMELTAPSLSTRLNMFRIGDDQRTNDGESLLQADALAFDPSIEPAGVSAPSAPLSIMMHSNAVAIRHVEGNESKLTTGAADEARSTRNTDHP